MPIYLKFVITIPIYPLFMQYCKFIINYTYFVRTTIPIGLGARKPGHSPKPGGKKSPHKFSDTDPSNLNISRFYTL